MYLPILAGLLYSLQTITSENELVDGKDVKAKVSGKYKHAPTGFSVDKLQVRCQGAYVSAEATRPLHSSAPW